MSDGSGSGQTVVLDASNFKQFIPADVANDPVFSEVKDLGSVFKDYISLKKGGGQVDLTKWRDWVPDDMKNDPALTPIKDYSGLVKSYINAQRMLGGEKFVLPTGKNDTPEVWNMLYEKLGRPKTPDEYPWKFNEGLPDGIQPDEKLDKWFRGVAHELGLNSKQASALRAKWNEARKADMLQSIQSFNKKHEETVQILQNEFGEEYPRLIDLANRVLKTYGGTQEEIHEFTETFANHPLVIRILAKVGKQLSEDALIKGGEADIMLSPENAKSKALDIATNKQNALYEAFHNKMHPKHKEAMEQYQRLFQIYTGEIKP